MNEKRFRANFDVSIYDSETEEYISASENGLKEIAKRMNEQQATINKQKEEIINSHIAYVESLNEIKNLKEENEQLRTQLLICQQSNDDGRFKVWEVPPIPKGTRITFSTTERSGKNE